MSNDQLQSKSKKSENLNNNKSNCYKLIFRHGRINSNKSEIVYYKDTELDFDQFDYFFAISCINCGCFNTEGFQFQVFLEQ